MDSKNSITKKMCKIMILVFIVFIIIGLIILKNTKILKRISIINKPINEETKIEYIGDGIRKTINKPISYIAALDISFSKITWQNEKASIQILANKKEKIEYQINGTLEENWQKGYNVGDLNHNDILYARIKEGNEVISEKNITIRDEIEPTEFEIEVATENIKSKSIKVNLKTIPQDNETGLKNYTYVAEKVEDKKEVPNILETSYNIIGLQPETEYNIYVLAFDYAGNYRKSNSILVKTLEYIGPSISEGEETHIPQEIEYTWEELNSIAKTISDNYGTEEGNINENTVEINVSVNGKNGTIGIGDWKTVNEKRVRILGFNHDELSNENAYGEGETNTYAGISFEYVESITSAPMNSSYSSTGGWKECNLRTTLNTTIYDSLENKEYIKEVNKQYIEKNDEADSLTISQDKTWLLSICEIEGESNYTIADEGKQYKFYSMSGNIKKGFSWWTRSPVKLMCTGGSCVSGQRKVF